MADTKIASIEDDAEFNTAEHRTGGDVLFADDPEMDGLAVREEGATGESRTRQPRHGKVSMVHLLPLRLRLSHRPHVRPGRMS